MLRVFCRSHKNADRCIQSLSLKRLYCNKNVEPAAKPAATSAQEPAAKPAATSAQEPDQSIHRRMYDVTNFDRKILVWTGRYKTAEEIPNTIPAETIERAKNKGRIKVCNYMIVATLLGCVFMAWSGKRAAERGESVHKMNLDWHQAVKEGRA